ncbi:MAG: tetratricopeptide repeat protein [Vulcanimicrobiaceae bacterium]
MRAEERAREHFERGEVERGLALLRAWCDASPGDARAWHAFGGALDTLGREREALEAYEAVDRIGIEALPGGERAGFCLSFGSTLRNVGQLSRSRATLAQAIAQYPEIAALRAFAALTEVSLGELRAAIDLLFEALLADQTDGSIARYRRALRGYADELRDASRSGAP